MCASWKQTVYGWVVDTLVAPYSLRPFIGLPLIQWQIINFCRESIVVFLTVGAKSDFKMERVVVWVCFT